MAKKTIRASLSSQDKIEFIKRKDFKKGIFITFEGGEKSGKSTQSKLLYKFLKQKGYSVIYLREPGTTNIGEKIRKILLDNKNNSITSLSEMLLYMASRSQMVEEVIKPNLKKGKIVICDRFLDSTVAYQGYGLGIDIKLIKYLGGFVTDNIQPDLTIFLDTPIKRTLRFLHKIPDRIEMRPHQYHQRVRKGYLRLASQEPKRIKIVRVDRDKNKTQERIRNLVDRFLESKYVI